MVIVSVRVSGHTSLQDTDIIEVAGDGRLVVKEPKTSVDLTKYTQEHTFVFDQVFDEHSTNQVSHV